MAHDPEATVAAILHLMATAGLAEYHGEAVTQLEHALQCAKLAVDAGSDDETVIAALLHDIGHVCAPPDALQMGGHGVVDHEGIGAQYLRERGFSNKVAELVEAHVVAKRYLTYKHPDYLAKLSEASLETLRYQGGPMSAAEADAFERDALFKEKLRLRSWDEQGKILGLDVPSLGAYRERLVVHLGAAG